MDKDTDHKPNVRRRLTIAGGAALVAAGIGGYAALSAAPTMRLAASSAVAAPAGQPADTSKEAPESTGNTEKPEPARSAADPAGGPDSNVQQDGEFEGNF